MTAIRNSYFQCAYTQRFTIETTKKVVLMTDLG